MRTNAIDSIHNSHMVCMMQKQCIQLRYGFTSDSRQNTSFCFVWDIECIQVAYGQIMMTPRTSKCKK